MKSDKFKGKSFEEISGEYGEEAAINAGIEADPETLELDEEWFKKARPASEVVPDIVESYLRLTERELEGGKIMLSIPLDADLAQYIRGLGPEWEEVVNDKLRRAFFST